MSTRSENRPRKQKTTIGNLALGFVFCVLFPGFITAIAPVSRIQLKRDADRISAIAHTCVFFVIPYKTQRVDTVTGVGDRFIAGKLSSRKPGERERDRVRSEDEAFLQIHGENESAEVSVSPVNIQRVLQQSEEFLNNPDKPELRLTVIANWKFGLIFGGLVTLLTFLYLIGLILLMLQFLGKLLRFRRDVSESSTWCRGPNHYGPHQQSRIDGLSSSTRSETA